MTEPTVVCVVDVAQRAQDLSGLPISLSLRRETLDGIPHFRFVTDPASILMTERSFNILFAASKTNYVGPKPLTKGISNGDSNVDPRSAPHSFGGELGETPKESPLPAQKGLEKGGNSFGAEFLADEFALRWSNCAMRNAITLREIQLLAAAGLETGCVEGDKHFHPLPVQNR